MKWNDVGVVVESKPFGEKALLLKAFTRDHGLQAGIVRYGRTSKKVAQFEVGNILSLTWSARLEEHLGSFTCELMRHTSASFFNEYPKLMAIASACSLVAKGFPEGQSHPESYSDFIGLFDMLQQEDWAQYYILWECRFLRELGFGFDFSQCAVTGVNNNLHYVSPRTGRAVSPEGAGEFKDKLLKLPSFLLDAYAEPTASANDNLEQISADIHDGLTLTGYFLERHVFLSHNQKVPPQRDMFVQALLK